MALHGRREDGQAISAALGNRKEGHKRERNIWMND